MDIRPLSLARKGEKNQLGNEDRSQYIKLIYYNRIMKYILMKNILNERKKIEITEEEFLKLKDSQEVLFHARSIEEIFDLVVNNYIELETKLFELSFDYLIHSLKDYFDSYKTRSALNSKLISLLTSVTLYRDTVEQHTKIILPEQKNIKQDIKELFEAKRVNTEFSFMEMLRNHIQHFGLPIHNVIYNSEWTSLDEDGMIEYSIKIESSSAYLFNDRSMRAVFENKIDKKINLIKLARIYIETIGEIQSHIRKIITAKVIDSRNTIEAAQNKYSDDENESYAGLKAFKIENNKFIDSIPLLLEWDDVRIELTKRNNNLKNLRKRYVTGAIKDDNK